MVGSIRINDAEQLPLDFTGQGSETSNAMGINAKVWLSDVTGFPKGRQLVFDAKLSKLSWTDADEALHSFVIELV